MPTGPVFTIVLPLLVAYAATAQWIVERWWMDVEQYGHVVLLPFVAAWGIAVRRPLPPARRDLRGLMLLVPGLCVHLIGAGLTIDSLSAMSLALTVPGACWLVVGAARTRRIASVLGLVPLAIPLPLFVTGQLVFELKEIAVRGGIGFAQLLGIDVVRDGVHLDVAGASAPLVVADACSGLQSLLALATLGYCLAFVMPGERAVWRRWVLFALAVPFAVFGNVARVAVICVLAARFDTPFASGTGHDIVSVSVWIGVLGALIGVDAVLARLGGRLAPSVSEATDEVPGAGGLGSLRRAGVALWVVAPILLVLTVYRPFVDSRDLARRLPEQGATFELVREYELTPRHAQLLGTDDAVWRRYRSGGEEAAASEDVFLVAVFHGTNWKSIHPPQLCLRGTNMELLENRTLALTDLGVGEPIGADVGYVRAVSNDAELAGRQYVSLYAFGGEDWIGASYWSFLMRHALRGTVRASTSGFLLRAETWCRPGEEPEQAARRCAELIDAMARRAQALLAERE